jgi:hypothetical protein
LKAKPSDSILVRWISNRGFQGMKGKRTRWDMRHSASAWGWLAFLGICLAGCERVEIDRTVEWSADGRRALFQDESGDGHAGTAEAWASAKVFAPDGDVLVSGSPIPNPVDDRVLFVTMARQEKLEGNRAAMGLPRVNLLARGPFLYRVWIKSSADSEPALLFKSRCNAPIYVANNLVVRWHPGGERLFCVDVPDQWEQVACEFDFTTKERRRVGTLGGRDLTFDFSPDGKTIAVCALGHFTTPAKSGLWLGPVDGPGEERKMAGGLEIAGRRNENSIMRTRETLPVWSPDGAWCAFVGRVPASEQGTDGEKYDLEASRIYVIDAASGKKEIIAATAKLPTDLTWRDGERLFYRDRSQGDAGRLHLWDRRTKVDQVVSGEDRVLRFCGFDPAGDRLAYVAQSFRIPLTPEELNLKEEEMKSLLLLPTMLDDQLVVRSGELFANRKVLVNGLSIGRARWSPDGTKLSAWLTFVPAYREAHIAAGLAFRAWAAGGDPAAVIDARTGAIDWMPTSALEKTYVGHYYLSNRRYDEAWDWYTKAEASGLVLETPKTIVEFFDSWIGMKNPRLYQAYCLEKLGRADEAVRYREEFARTFLMARPEKPPEGEKTPLDELLEVRSMSLWRMAAEAEMYASVNALRDGIAVFERRKRRWWQADEE